MKILVPIKRVVDYQVKIKIKSDNSAVDTSNVKMSMNPFDEIAVEEAVRLKEAGIADEIVILSIGSTKSEEIIRNALAMGADRGILVNYDQMTYPLSVAKLLESVVKEERPNLVIMGKQAIDGDCNQAGQMLAELLNWPQATFISEVKITDNNLEAIREVDGGLLTLKMQLPAIITTDLRLNEPRFLALPNIMKARSKPLIHKTPDDYNVNMNPEIEVLKVEYPPEISKECIKFDTSAELVNNLKKEGII
ncbi:MAG: electron transfer flavoprotein subunit beta/FixA family protein [Pseudomonadota bacterium]